MVHGKLLKMGLFEPLQYMRNNIAIKSHYFLHYGEKIVTILSGRFWIYQKCRHYVRLPRYFNRLFHSICHPENKWYRRNFCVSLVTTTYYFQQNFWFEIQK